MPDEATSQESIEVGRAMAAEVIAFRNQALEERSAALAEIAAAVPGVEVEAFASDAAFELAEAVGGSATAGVLVAEGDSWFDYPWNDVLRLLEDRHGYDVESVAHKGDRIEDMAYAGGQLEELVRRIEKVLRRGQIPKAILLSGGGNDIAGDELAMLINHARSAAPGLNEHVVRGVIDERIRLAYLAILSAVTVLVEERLRRRIPILVHGYDRPVPDGRGFWGGWGPFPGPWLEPSFRKKAYEALPGRIALIGKLIDRFNEMLKEVAATPGFDHVRYVDLRDTLSTGPDYQEWWANELHPTKKGFTAVAQRFAAAI